jgi:hypothetical protein
MERTEEKKVKEAGNAPSTNWQHSHLKGQREFH